MAKKILLTVIIPTLNEEKYIGELLACLKIQTLKEIEVIVADANSTDTTREIVKKYGNKLVEGGRQAFGRNNGAKVANGEILVFMDADISFYSDFLARCYKDFTNLKADLACTYFITKGFTFEMKFVYNLWNIGKFLRRHSMFPDGEGQFLMIKKSAFEKIKGFDETLRISEDVDLIYRATKAGFQFKILKQGFVPSIRRYQKVGILRVFLGSLISGIGQIFGRQHGKALTEQVYGGWGDHDEEK